MLHVLARPFYSVNISWRPLSAVRESAGEVIHTSGMYLFSAWRVHRAVVMTPLSEVVFLPQSTSVNSGVVPSLSIHHYVRLRSSCDTFVASNTTEGGGARGSGGAIGGNPRANANTSQVRRDKMLRL